MCGSVPDTFRVRVLVIEFELDPILRGQGDDDNETVLRALTELVGEIRSHMRESTSVVIRGCTSALRLKFSKALMGLQSGSLGNRCQ